MSSDIMIISIFLFFLICLYFIIRYINNLFIYHPEVVSTSLLDIYMEEIKDKYSDFNITEGFLDSTDDYKVNYILLRHKNELDKNLFVFAHGNGGNLFSRLTCEQKYSTDHLLKFGSLLIFDYRGYGISSGTISEKGIHDDMKTVWQFANTLYQPKNIILYGESLGCAVVSKLGASLAVNTMPKYIIMQSGFYNIKRMASELVHPLAKYIVTSNYDNNVNIGRIKQIGSDCEIILMHSKDDELIPYKHSEDLVKKHSCTLIEINGSHGLPKYTKQIYDKLYLITDSKFE